MRFRADLSNSLPPPLACAGTGPRPEVTLVEEAASLTRVQSKGEEERLEEQRVRAGAAGATQPVRGEAYGERRSCERWKLRKMQYSQSRHVRST